MLSKTIKDLLKWGTAQLLTHQIENAQIESEWLLSHLLKCERVYLHLYKDRDVDSTMIQKFKALVERRSQREPLQLILKSVLFQGLTLNVLPGVFIPRPETEELVQEFLKVYQNEGSALAPIFDLGTGTGAIALSVAKRLPQIKVYACDQSEQALELAQTNARRNKIDNVSFFKGNFLEAFPLEVFKPVSWVVSNPPYLAYSEASSLEPELEFDPEAALYAGETGLEAYQAILKQIQNYPGIQFNVAFEIGDQQGDGLQNMLKKIFDQVEMFQDINRFNRILIGKDMHNSFF